MKYKMIKDSVINPDVLVGTTVYTCLEYDFGCAETESIFTGKAHVSVTLNPAGGYPCFVVPVDDLELQVI